MKSTYKVNEEVVKKIAERVYDNGSTVINRNDLEEMFPELAESDDERIRKALLEMVHDTTGDELWVDYGVHKEDALAWLEKQYEHANFRNKIQIGDKVTRNRDGVLVNLSQLNRVAKDEKQGEQKPIEPTDLKTWKYIVDAVLTEREGIGQYIDSHWTTDVAKKLQKRFGNIEQKPAWSEEDEFELENVLCHLRNYLHKDSYIRYENWLKSLKDRIQPQPKQEWSEEDEKMYTATIFALAGFMGNEDKLNWLNALRGRYTWKPSEEQIKALEDSIEFLGCTKKVREDLKSLYEQLKKLREE